MKLTVDFSGLHEAVRQMGAQDLVTGFSIALAARSQEPGVVKSSGIGTEDSATATTADNHSAVSRPEESQP
ncbi:MAG: hypothetical protein V2J55_07660 [Candidatus Competibacteraceae bacterium]|jgi:hypothetical protein|nr:hypothetical protein [Candidatus Competibacteraceae bacterium]